MKRQSFRLVLPCGGGNSLYTERQFYVARRAKGGASWCSSSPLICAVSAILLTMDAGFRCRLNRNSQ